MILWGVTNLVTGRRNYFPQKSQIYADKNARAYTHCVVPFRNNCRLYVAKDLKKKGILRHSIPFL